MEEEKKEFGRWWVWVLALIVLTIIVLGAISFTGRWLGVTGERFIFETSIQKHSADDAKRGALEAELAGIGARLQNRSSLSQTEVDDLTSQQRALQFQLNAMD